MSNYEKRLHAIFIYTFVFSLGGIFNTTICTKTDIACLKSIKASFEDPEGHLSEWTFNNDTENFFCEFVGFTCWNDMDSNVLVELPDIGLKGQFPAGIENCTCLTYLDLSGNNFHGPIPDDIAKRIPFVTELDLSYNNLSGVIPPDTANCSFLNELLLDHNSLTGQIPQEIGGLNRLKRFSVSNNRLSGEVPDFIYVDIPPESYENNKGLCGKPLKRCREGWRWRFDYSFNNGFAIGYVVSVIAAVVIYASYFVPWVHAKRDEFITVPEMVMLMVRSNSKNKKAKLEQLGNLSTLEFLLEKEVINGQGLEQEIFQCLRVAGKCVQQFPKYRPSMLDVYMTISSIGKR